MSETETPKCAYNPCDNLREFKNTGYCQSHQIQHRRGGELKPLSYHRGNKGIRVECKVPTCDAYARTAGYCKSHYMKWQKTKQEPTGPGSPKHCKYGNCNRAVDVRGYCETHYKHVRDSGDVPWAKTRRVPCRVEGCERTGQYAMCHKHAGRATRFGLSWDELAELMANRTCEACGFEGQDLHIHHDHSCCPQSGRSCGKCVRLYLCGQCNTAAGMVGDDASRLRQLANALENATQRFSGRGYERRNPGMEG